MSDTTAPDAAPRRRNGTQQACEPCRKRKVACDHRMPVCRRCIKRKTTAECIYLSSHITAARPTSPKPRIVEPPTDIKSSDTESSGVPLFPRLSSSGPSSKRKTEPIRPSSKPTFFSAPAAYLGATSFSAVFEENAQSLASPPVEHQHYDSVPSTRQNSVQPEHVDPSDAGDSSPPIDPDLIQLGVQVLAGLPSEAVANDLYPSTFNSTDGWAKVTGRLVARSFWLTFGADLASRKPHALYRISELLCRNTQEPFRDNDDPQAWLESFTGKHMRWECIGMLCTDWAFGGIKNSEHSSSKPAPDGSQIPYRQLVKDMKDHAQTCIALSSHAYDGNTLMVYLLYCHCVLESMVTGDSSLTVWRLHGDLVSVVLSLGMHREVQTGSQAVTIGTETRRSLYSTIFNIDKVIATFTGRPPLLSGRYRTTPLPLDLSGEALLAGGDVLKREVESLDPQGWNTQNQLMGTTMTRSRILLSSIRDEVLEIALGNTPDNAAEYIKQCMERSSTTYAQLPAIARLHPGDLQNESFDAHTLYCKILVRVEHLQTLFICERLLARMGRAVRQELIDVSREILSLILTFWRQRDRMTGRHMDDEWMLMYFAVPAAGMLCVELLRQCSPSGPSSLALPKAEVIRNLTMLVEFLDWIKPSAPNAALIQRTREIVSQVLDRVLNASAGAPSTSSMPAPPPPQAVPPSGPMWPTTSQHDPTALEPTMSHDSDKINFDLLDTFDWDNVLGPDWNASWNDMGPYMEPS